MQNENITAYLKTVDEVIARGRFKDNWLSLSQFKTPSWLREGRFGIFIHWGVYSVPAFASEWYPRLMYDRRTPCFLHRVRHYGKDADYRQIAELFNPQSFDAEEWVSLFKESGAAYIMPVHEHHDGIKLYRSVLNRWNTFDMPTHRDYMAELKAAAEAQGLGFLASNHRAEHYWFLNGARKNCPNSEVLSDEYRDLYGPAALLDGSMDKQEDIRCRPTREWCEDWLASACEMIDRSRPLAVYFDWWVSKPSFNPYMKKFMAYYFNRAEEWGVEPVVFDKWGAAFPGTCINDIERGQAKGIQPELWQCDTSTSRTSWGYTEPNVYKSAYELVTNMIDVVSKNGCFMLNVGPKADGTICEKDEKLLREIGAWMQVNGEAIRGSKPFFTFGEGRKQATGLFVDVNSYGPSDLRFTVKDDSIYVFTMGKKPKNTYKVKTLAYKRRPAYPSLVKSVEVLGFPNRVHFAQSKLCMELKIDGEIKSGLPLCFKLKIR